MAQSSIEWTEMTWNPTTGCTKISAGCKFCYAEVMSKRLKAMGVEKYKDNFKVRVHEPSLKIPYTSLILFGAIPKPVQAPAAVVLEEVTNG